MIEIGSKWVHTITGNQYEVVEITNGTYDFGKTNRDIVWYKDQQGEIYVRTEKHFLDSFKPYEPVYEYKWLIIPVKNQHGCNNEPYISSYYFTDIDSIKYHLDYNGFAFVEIYKIEETKRERK